MTDKDNTIDGNGESQESKQMADPPRKSIQRQRTQNKQKWSNRLRKN